MSDAEVFFETQPNQWLGIPRTAQSIVPASGGLRYGASIPGANLGDAGGLSRSRLRIVGADIGNVTAGACGLVMLFPDEAWIAGQWVQATTTFTDGTTNAQSSTIDSFALFTLTANDGFIVAAKLPFNIFSVDQTTASAGGVPVFDYAFWGVPVDRSSATIAWQIVATNLITPTWTAAAAERLVVLNAPFSAMSSTTAGAITGLPAGYYALRVRATTAPTVTAGSAARLYTGREVYRLRSAGANSENPIAGGTGRGPRTVGGGIALQAYYATAAASNSLYVEYN